MRILLVEDNRDLASWLDKALRQAHYAVDTVYNGEDADHALRVADYALVILDLSLPKMDGMTVLRRLRKSGSTVPVIILTANASLGGRVAGLDEGADDYLAKPFEIAELEARIRAQLRRGHNRANPEIELGELLFDGRTRQFFLSGKLMSLTPREHAVLEHLIFKAGTTVSKTVLCESVFGFNDLADANAIEIYVHRVRKKLEGSSVKIATLRGMGYLLRHGE
ncbi:MULTISPECIES: response regulator [Phyllobacterium]|jgi:two-component system, OmpR family, response regulator TctD|uniref:DNA-binding response regulator n=1 Tax=Phyllobacterium myrsinacearum TaxID=28101 RepID=A0A2S9JQD7_9HYPH|nr:MULTISPECIES: response regulator [Phyllobacterium]MBQ9349673.1 response regulator [Phyllobacterium sp.]MBZ3694759.1 response regulator [Phyllobacterium calauticae]PRD55292.1 DNA-binding response regulator [Phyllobacterium myrsinacearum]PWV89296.1 two-component system response regulator TctD [Phyllobacterium myrsinacearum]RZS79520.1 two-component system response regulator TctD [Phyllobacterium myrsinacearum]|eukprot:gene11189-13713_t